MADLRPFRAWRPVPERADQVASPPYDVLSSVEAKAVAAGNPLSFLHVIKPEIDLDPGIDPYDARVYAKGAENLQRLRDNRVIIRDPAPCYYLYRQRMGDHIQTGLVAAAGVEEYDSGLIKKHELTRPQKELDRTRHVETLNANTGPVFLTYRAATGIDETVAELTTRITPTYDVAADDGVRHTVWVVADTQDVERIDIAFRDVEALYVADGHHRAASASRVRKKRMSNNPAHTGAEPYNYFLTVIFPHNQVLIMDYNRVVRDLAGMSVDEFLTRVERSFTITPGERVKPQKPRRFGMLLEDAWRWLEPLPGTVDVSDPVANLDVSMLQDNLLGPVLRIGDPRTDERIDFVGGIRGLEELEKRCREGWVVAFSLYPTTVEQLMAVADAGKMMPPKSTWFEPKLRSGLIIRSLEE
jgi:uncharacterized protein (DUF1015 family)